VITCPTTEGCSIDVTYSQATTNSVSVEVGIGIKEIFSASFGYEWSETTTTQTSSTFNIPGSASGVITFTPILTCHTVTANACGDDVPDGNFEMCASKKNPDGSLHGNVAFLQQN